MEAFFRLHCELSFQVQHGCGRERTCKRLASGIDQSGQRRVGVLYGWHREFTDVDSRDNERVRQPVALDKHRAKHQTRSEAERSGWPEPMNFADGIRWGKRSICVICSNLLECRTDQYPHGGTWIRAQAAVLRPSVNLVAESGIAVETHEH